MCRPDTADCDRKPRMDKYLRCLMVNISLVIVVGLLTGNAAKQKEESDGLVVDETYDTRSVIRQRHLLEAETTAAPPVDKDVWTRIREFYADKNNMAMFCVLPIMVLIYGGCSTIYCVAKCKRYLHRRKRTQIAEERIRLSDDDQNEVAQNDLNNLAPNITESPKNNFDTSLPSGPFISTPLPFSPTPITVTPTTLGAPPRPLGATPPPWYIQKNQMSSPISSLPPALALEPLSRKDSHRDEKRRDYKELLRIKTPQINSAFGSQDEPELKIEPSTRRSSEDASGRESVASYKDELMARYDALSTFTMARKAAHILKSGSNVEKKKDPDLFSGKTKQKMIFIAE